MNGCELWLQKSSVTGEAEEELININAVDASVVGEAVNVSISVYYKVVLRVSDK